MVERTLGGILPSAGLLFGKHERGYMCDLRERSDMYGLFVGETFSYIGFLNQHLQSDAPIENDTVMYVYQPQYFQMLPNIMATVKKRTIANYIAFNIVYFFSEYSSDEIRNLTYGNTSRTQKSEERLCIRIAKTFMSLAIGRMYVDRYYSPLTRMHSHMKNAKSVDHVSPSVGSN
ncbi:hypothetical protein AVEN_252001-1 [Araneus ventricosus]|uniref:Peptidase M13 N-terminal domain-containing protein n=1 Tax=Araneus ventricosus TaxID=182803 RepID=A0A4Y2SJ28_ARAVE|nr:hypothetical protein AVEN_252001-1 [Araneus ventricosus]